MPRTSCLDCGRITSPGPRCPEHSQRFRRPPASRGAGRLILKLHRMHWGNWCPGWERDSHWTSELVVDHAVPLSRGGSDLPTNMQVICASCNQAKGEQIGWTTLSVGAQLNENNEAIVHPDEVNEQLS